MLEYLKQEERSSDMPSIGSKYQVLLYGALHAPFISKLYGSYDVWIRTNQEIFIIE